ncbi:hypothetical protein KDA14_05620, partial [Candidatus Saccharibacteria bacterium]|nr:hypothetical protein [Candidatus Saccharibacteria bacterium]
KDIERCVHWVEKCGKDVYVSALDKDSKRNPFGSIVGLMPFALITKLSAVCMSCHRYSAYETRRIPHSSGGKGRIVVGGADKYQALCLKCYQEHAKKV